MPCGKRKLPHERLEPCFEYISFDFNAADWIWPVTDHHALAELARHPHTVRNGVNEGIYTAAHILQVADEHVYVFQHLFRRLTRLAVQRVDRKPRLCIARV